MPHLRRLAALGVAVAAIGLLVSAVAWACVPEGSPGTLEVTPAQARPGEQVKISGTAGAKDPVSLYLASGPLVATVPVSPGADGHGFQFAATVTLPTDAPLGSTLLVASQGDLRWQTALNLLGAAPAVVVTATPGATTASPKSSGPAGRTALGAAAAGVGVLAVAAAVVLGRRRKPSAEEERSGILVG